MKKFDKLYLLVLIITLSGFTKQKKDQNNLKILNHNLYSLKKNWTVSFFD